MPPEARPSVARRDVAGPGLAFRPPPIDRSFERRIVVGGILIAASFLVAALAAMALPAADRRGVWLPLHLALAGGASTAIAAVMPFFVAAFAAVPPADPRLRSAAVALVAAGAALVVVGIEAGFGALAAAGGAAYVAGIGATAAAVLRPVGGSLGPSRGLVTRAYVVALVYVGLGVTLATLVIAGWSPAVEVWAWGKPTHAWLNLVGFVSLVIATTLLHFFPTVVGARIASRRSARLAVLGLGGGAPVAALGTLLGITGIAQAGAIATALGCAALATYAWQTWRSRSPWTTDPGWHRFAIGGLISALGWFAVGIAVLTWRTVIEGASPAAWSTAAVGGPLIVGWVGMTVLASATHLLPAVGPGSPVAHARQRSLLGLAATPRLVILDAGCLLLSLGLGLNQDDLARSGTILLATGALATVGLLAAAVAVGMRSTRGRT